MVSVKEEKAAKLKHLAVLLYNAMEEANMKMPPFPPCEAEAVMIIIFGEKQASYRSYGRATEFQVLTTLDDIASNTIKREQKGERIAVA